MPKFKWSLLWVSISNVPLPPGGELLEIAGDHWVSRGIGGVQQMVYLPVQRTLRYTESLYAKHLSGPSVITVSLRRANSREPLTTAKIDATASSSTKYSFTLYLPANSLHRLGPADFAVPWNRMSAFRWTSCH